MKSDRIAQVLLTPRVGGAETLAASLEREWSQRGLTSKIFYLEEGAPTGRAHRFRQLRRALGAYRPDVVIAHSALPNIYARLAAPARSPVVPVLHSAGDDFESRSLRWAELVLTQRTDAVVAVSDAQFDRYTARFPRMRTRTLVIPNGVPADLPKKLAYPATPRNVVAMSRFTAQKNPALWLRAAETVGAPGSAMEFDWWGPVDTDTAIEQVVSEARASVAKVRICGPTGDPGAVLAAGDIFFHSSDREAHSVSILEAAAVGLPIICARDVAQTLPRGLAFATFDAGDASSAAQALRTVVANWSAAIEHAIGSRDKVREQYSSKRCASTYLELIATLRR